VPIDVICGIGDVSAFTVSVFAVILHDPKTVQVPAPPRLASPHKQALVILHASRLMTVDPSTRSPRK
jgi:hypothetical protein